jgi:hypothetical protein
MSEQNVSQNFAQSLQLAFGKLAHQLKNYFNAA